MITATPHETANTHLIAASPDLLALCQRTLKILEDPDANEFDANAHAFAIREAIRKATN